MNENDLKELFLKGDFKILTNVSQTTTAIPTNEQESALVLKDDSFQIQTTQHVETNTEGKQQKTSEKYSILSTMWWNCVKRLQSQSITILDLSFQR